MKLLVEELKSTLTQTFLLELQTRKQIHAIRPHLYVHNAPSGTFTLSLKQGATTLGSKSFTVAELRTLFGTSDNFIHGFPKIDFSTPVAVKTGTFSLELSSSGYTFSESAYLGWVKDHESIFYTINGGAPSNDRDLPLNFEIWTYRKESRV